MRAGMVAVSRAVSLLLLSGLAQAQVTTATFHAVVNDSSGAVIAGATVTMAHEATAAATTKITNAFGEGAFDFLRAYKKTLQYVNRDAFVRAPVGAVSQATLRPGNVSVGAIRAPGLWNVDLSLTKNFSLSERVKFQFRSDMFNFFNHTNLAGLRTSINDRFFGQLLGTRGARVIQLNARLSF